MDTYIHGGRQNVRALLERERNSLTNVIYITIYISALLYCSTLLPGHPM
jgi:hypothetical protein